jgi:hypothetical protein
MIFLFKDKTAAAKTNCGSVQIYSAQHDACRAQSRPKLPQFNCTALGHVSLSRRVILRSVRLPSLALDIAATSACAERWLQLPLGFDLIAGGERQLRVVRSSIKDVKLLQVVV